MLPNPLQELAARLRQELIAIAKEKAGDDAAKLSFAGVLINAITPALGTLLQAEREAERKLTLEAAAKWFDERMIKTHGYPSYIGDTLRSLSMDAQFATGDASALAAVVQRETEKLKDLLWETYRDLEHLYGHECDADGTFCFWCSRDVYTEHRPDVLDNCEKSPYKKILDKLAAIE